MNISITKYYIFIVGFFLWANCQQPAQKGGSASETEAIQAESDSTISATVNEEDTLPEVASETSLSKGKSKSDINISEFPYDLSNPKSKFKLPNKLVEISGLSYTTDGQLATLQDERGEIFMFDIHKGEVGETYPFGKKGDYEGLEIIGDTAYALRSDGVVFRINDYRSSAGEVFAYKTALSSRNDTEGLGFLAQENQLLIACKATPNIKGKKQKGSRAIYRFDLGTRRLVEEPFIHIQLDEVKKFINDNAYTRFSKDLAKIFSPGGDLNFQPSAIAIHPLTQDIYITASVGKLLLVFSQDKVLKYMIPLDKGIFKQPEGICFSPRGDLFISNEGKGGRGNILWFDYQPLLRKAD